MSAAMKKISMQGQDIARMVEGQLEAVAGERVGFSLFVWTKGRCTYVSNCPDRAEIITVLEQMIESWKKGMPDIPAHEVQ